MTFLCRSALGRSFIFGDFSSMTAYSEIRRQRRPTFLPSRLRRADSIRASDCLNGSFRHSFVNQETMRRRSGLHSTGCDDDLAVERCPASRHQAGKTEIVAHLEIISADYLQKIGLGSNEAPANHFECPFGAGQSGRRFVTWPRSPYLVGRSGISPPGRPCPRAG